MQYSGMNTVRAGYVALTDCAPIIVAQELGFDRQHGILIEPVKLQSWASVRDALAFEKLECAQMPGALSLAMHLGLSGVQTATTVPLLLGNGGNAITVSNDIYAQATELLGPDYVGKPAESAALIRAVAAHRKVKGDRKVRLATVHSFSSHNYEIRAWLAHAGLDPDIDVELSVVSRSKMVDALTNGEVDGFCVGDPWGQQAVLAGAGVTVATKADLYPFSPEKVLAFRSNWVHGHSEVAASTVKAIEAAIDWSARPSNHTELALLLAQPEYLGVSSDIILRALSCKPHLSLGGPHTLVENYLSFGKANRPTDNDALWLLAQMRRWGQVPAGLEALVRGVFAPLETGDERTSLSARVDGAKTDPSKQAFDGVPFHAKDIEAYWRSFPIGCHK